MPMPKCELCGAQRPASYADWEWFTGFFDRTVHICSACAAKHRANVDRLLAASRVQPEAGIKRTSADRAVAFIVGERNHG